MFRRVRKKIHTFRKKDLSISFKTALSDNYVLAYWSKNQNTYNNWGDALNPVLINKLTGKKTVHVNDIYNFANKSVHVLVGSLLEQPVPGNMVVWGAGFIDKDSSLKNHNVKICAVRGPLTRAKLLKNGIDCPKVFGDPALLWPDYYPKEKNPKYKLGIIPHYVDQSSPHLEKFKNRDDILLIDIKGGINKVIDQILKCECIASSSLHGLIMSDAYGIPSVWVRFSDKVLGGDFKYQDYFLSVGRKVDGPVDFGENTTLKSLTDSKKNYKIRFDKNRLLEACPLIRTD